MSNLQAMARDFAISPRRFWIGLFWVCGLIVLQIWQVVGKRDDWPLSAYPMYSGLQRPTASKEELRAVAVDGELSLTENHLEPLSPRTVALVLRHADSRHGRAIRRAILERYYQRRAAGLHDGPSLSSLRQYRYTWAVRPDLSNKAKPNVSVVQRIPAFEPSLMDALDAEGRGKGEPPHAIDAGAGAIVLQLATGTLGGAAQLQVDRFAAKGNAVAFPEPADVAREEGGAEDAGTSVETQDARATPSAYVDVRFDAPAGRYWVWLRGKSKKGSKHDSVWVQLDRQIGTSETTHEDGLGQFREVYPGNAFGWASAGPISEPVELNLKGDEPHVLRVGVREGPVVIDQVVLSKTWTENPGEMGPAR